jgi:hypothetical protein
MANLPEVEIYDAGVYQLELIDPVVGGADGKSNAAARNLANRTKWLKAQVDSLIAAVSMDAHVADSDPHSQYLTKVGGQNCSHNYANSSSETSTTAYTATYTPAVTTLVDGMELIIDIGDYTNSTTTPTFSPNGVTARTIKNQGGVALAVGDMPKISILRYDSTGLAWILQNRSISNALSAYLAKASLTIGTSTYDYLIIPMVNRSGGAAVNLIIQWGVENNTGVGPFSATFPIAFPNACLYRHASNDDANTGTPPTAMGIVFTCYDSYSTTTLKAYTRSGTGTGGVSPEYWTWLAIGY